MSSRKRPLAEISQNTTTPTRSAHHQTPRTPHTAEGSGVQSRSARSRSNVGVIRPDSARDILRRLAKVTAPITHRWIVTPQRTLSNKENSAPERTDERGQTDKTPKFDIDFEDSIESDEDVFVVPTPSALLDDDSSDVEVPTTTFDSVPAYETFAAPSQQAERRKSRVSFISIPAVPDSTVHNVEELTQKQDAEDVEGDTTYLSERGRRAISMQPTVLSRYSFGSIDMDEFRSELEIRRDSGRREKVAELEQDGYNGEFDVASLDNGDVAAEFDVSRNARQSSSVLRDDIDDFPFKFVNKTASARQRRNSELDLVPDDAISLLGSNVDGVERSNHAPMSPSERRNKTLRESVTSKTRARPRKRLKISKSGNEIPCLPASLMKRVVHESYAKDGKKRPGLGKEHMAALEQATEWFFEQVSEDLSAYSQHGGRKKRIVADDVLVLMRRQRVLSEAGALSQFARAWLPKEMLSQLKLPDEL